MNLTRDQLKQILLEQREVLLKKPLGIEREILKEIETKMKLPHVIVIMGLRRSGKSTLMRQIIAKFYNNKNFYYITFEDERLLNFPATAFNNIYEVLIELFGEEKTFFIDEIQNVQGFEGFIRRFYEAGFKLFITGSNAKLLSGEISTKLTGRHLDILVKPFSFKEYLAAKKFNFNGETFLKTTLKAQLKKYFEEFLLSGGMPEYVIFGDSEILAKIYEDIIIKDIAVRHKINNVIQLRELYQYLITNFSRKFSYNALKRFITIGSANTIKKYVDYLVESYIAIIVNKFDYSVKKQLINDKKFYLIDNGFVRPVSVKATIDRGWLLENLIVIHLMGKNFVFYYSSKYECDFITIKENKVNIAIQAAYEITEENREREIMGLIEAMKELKIDRGFILTNDQEEEVNVQETKILITPVWKWLLQF